jgi:DNA-binding NtrC family response regulator
MNQEKVLIVEDEENARTGLAELVSGWGFRTETAKDGMEGLEKVTTWSPSIVLTDLKMPRMDGMELLERLAENSLPLAVVVITAQGNIETAVEAMKLGAYDFIEKPIDSSRLKSILNNASRLRGAEVELEVTRRKLKDAGVLGSLVGSAKKMQDIFSLVQMVAPSTASVLITGESGTGKELVARTLHELSSRKTKPFVAINCSAIPETLIESEIFGHEKGAFTGALERRAGCFELAEEGTLLLDEIGEMPIGTQAKLLRVLEDKVVYRVGGTVPIHVDTRIVAATNRNLAEQVRAGKFREDLYYRLTVVTLELPPLRERREDILVLADFFLEQFCRDASRRRLKLSAEASKRLEQHNWPGNVRELRNLMERVVVLVTKEMVGHLDLMQVLNISVAPADEEGPLPLREARARFERQYIMERLAANSGNLGDTARELGLDRSSLYLKMKQLQIPSRAPKASRA